MYAYKITTPIRWNPQSTEVLTYVGKDTSQEGLREQILRDVRSIADDSVQFLRIDIGRIRMEETPTGVREVFYVHGQCMEPVQTELANYDKEMYRLNMYKCFESPFPIEKIDYQELSLKKG